MILPLAVISVVVRIISASSNSVPSTTIAHNVTTPEPCSEVGITNPDDFCSTTTVGASESNK